MKIIIAIGLLLVGIIILFSRKRKSQNKNFVHVSQRINEYERRL